MKFDAWIQQQRKREDAVGDFARDWLADADRPKTVRIFDDIDGRLSEMDASPGAIRAAEKAWDEYREHVADEGPRYYGAGFAHD